MKKPTVSETLWALVALTAGLYLRFSTLPSHYLILINNIIT